MFRDMFVKVRIVELCDEGPDHHDKDKQDQPGIDDESNRPAANERSRSFQISERGVHRFLASRSGVMHDAVHRNNVNQRESSEATRFPLLISAIAEVRYTGCEQGQRAQEGQ